MFDMVIMDEASQCNIAVSLVPILRGESLMLVGDPQQLNPVILLDELTNDKLRKRYTVSDEYDYRKNSIYKTYLACDAVSDETLLHNHYRCHKNIIGLTTVSIIIPTQHPVREQEEQPLVYLDMQDTFSELKNTAPAEAGEIARYAALNKDKKYRCHYTLCQPEEADRGSAGPGESGQCDLRDGSCLSGGRERRDSFFHGDHGADPGGYIRVAEKQQGADQCGNVAGQRQADRPFQQAASGTSAPEGRGR